MERGTVSWRVFTSASLIAIGGVLASCADSGAPAPVTVSAPPSAPAPPARAASRPGAGKPRTIIVQPGQSLGRVALAYHVSKQAIIAANHLEPPYELKAGARLHIPDGTDPNRVAVAAPAPAKKTVPVRPERTPVAAARSEKPSKAPAKAPASEPEVIPLD